MDIEIGTNLMNTIIAIGIVTGLTIVGSVFFYGVFKPNNKEV